LVATEAASVSGAREFPFLGYWRTSAIVKMEMRPVAIRNTDRDAPALVQRVVERADEIAIDRFHFVMVARYFPDAHFVAPGPRLILVDIFEAQVQPQARIACDTLQVPTGVHHTECGAARGECNFGAPEQRGRH